MQEFDTVTMTATDIETTLVPTTYVSVWTTTETDSENSTVERVVSSTVIEVRISPVSLVGTKRLIYTS